MLMEENKMERISFSVDHVDPMTHLFDDMKMWYTSTKTVYLSKVKRRCMLLPDEPKPVIRFKCMRHTPKVMVLAAVAQPRHDPVTSEFFDGKLGTWPFLKLEPAKRSLCDRPTGSMVPFRVTENKTSYRRITVQQHNAPPPHPARRH
ncbi:hypothetical protein PR001_g21950 [Phytophthora rubi]|uniref:DDE-1 domain-containing protein n=1 Tax=Phytophthora rubi TaxID=129364 RepID=A0A6A3J998_9STRA|nr:hypothetical protein PR001_g21950 [Phytophthora rubi]